MYCNSTSKLLKKILKPERTTELLLARISDKNVFWSGPGIASISEYGRGRVDELYLAEDLETDPICLKTSFV
jgi:hypothetical protein